MDVGIRELKNSLSRYLREVQQGETVTVTEHGRPVARLVPVGGRTAFDRLVATGRITPARPGPRPTPKPTRAGDSLLGLLDEQRG